VVAADGANSLTRQSRQNVFRPSIDARRARYIWLGTPLVFEAFKFFTRRVGLRRRAGAAPTAQ